MVSEYFPLAGLPAKLSFSTNSTAENSPWAFNDVSPFHSGFSANKPLA